MVKALTLKQRYEDYLKAPRTKGSKVHSFNEWVKEDRKFQERLVARAIRVLNGMNLDK